MESKLIREVFIIFVASIILAVSVSMFNPNLFLYALVSFFIIIGLNVLTKKIFGYFVETDVKTRFWSVYYYWFGKKDHFKKPLIMAWLPLVLSIVSRGVFWWFAILSFDVSVRPERVARRHGLYRFTEVTEWHIALIAMSGIITNVFLSIIGYILDFNLFAKLSIVYAFWSIIPISDLDGAKILFGSKGLWVFILIIFLFIFGWSQLIF